MCAEGGAGGQTWSQGWLRVRVRWSGRTDLEPGVAEGLLHAVALPHLHLQQVGDEVGGCGAGGGGRRVSSGEQPQVF